MSRLDIALNKSDQAIPVHMGHAEVASSLATLL